MAFRMAGITNDDMDVYELYDCSTYTMPVTLEDYCFCAKGEGGPFVEHRKLRPGGSLPTNTGGGQLSGYYMWGMTSLSEGVIQARGQGRERPAPKHDTVLVSCQGGVLNPMRRQRSGCIITVSSVGADHTRAGHPGHYGLMKLMFESVTARCS